MACFVSRLTLGQISTLTPVASAYDVMAGLLLVREAGGRVSDYVGGERPQLQERGRYVASNGHVHPEMLEVLRSCGH